MSARRVDPAVNPTCYDLFPHDQPDAEQDHTQPGEHGRIQRLLRKTTPHRMLKNGTRNVTEVVPVGPAELISRKYNR